ncbi:hypothetical protein ACLHDG_04095 [Sulfurovum sp. CS9]|uniref:hypothetical protein n=1 Tax=Sulfurovum sp. CS9 TaxID=3391146 RepID=UPI0039E8034E
MVKLQKWVIDNNKRLLVIFEGMDTAGKSSTTKEFNNYLNPREARSVALPKPNSKELGQWYFQRHLKQIPNVVRYLLLNVDYVGKDTRVITGVDKQIVKLHNKGKYYGKCNHRT